MQRLYLGIICGLVFGSIDAAMMIPMSFPDKRAAMLGAFIARFALGFVICNIKLPWAGWFVGLLSRHPVKSARRNYHQSHDSNYRVWRSGRHDHRMDRLEVRPLKK